MRDLEPKTAPAAGRVAGEEARGRRADGVILLLDRGDQLLDQRPAAGAVVGRVGEHMVTQPAVRVKNHVQELDAVELRRADLKGAVVVAAEAGDFVDDWVSLLRRRRERLRQYNSATELDRPPVEIAEQLALGLHQLDAVRLGKRLLAVDLVDRQGDRPARRRVEFGANNPAMTVAFGAREAEAAVEVHDCDERVGARLHFPQRDGAG